MYHDTIIDGKDTAPEALKKLLGDPVGYTIARTARILGISRQAVVGAINADALHAKRIYVQTGKKKTLISNEVDRDSVEEYLNARQGRKRAPFGYRADQIRLPLA